MRRRSAHLALTMALLLASLLTLPAVSAAKDKEKEKGKKEEEKYGPSIRVAIFPFVNATDEVGATRIMEDLMRDQLKTVDPARATFLHPADVERLLSDREATARIDLLNDRWGKDRSLDSTAIAGLDSLLMVAAPVVGAGQSNTTVGLSFALFDPRTKALLWSKNPREQRFSPELDPSSANVNYDETGVIQRKSDNAPPRFEAVAGDLIRDAFKKFPRW